MSYLYEPYYDQEREDWSTALDIAFEADPTQFDAATQNVIRTMLSGEPVSDLSSLYDAYEEAVEQYKRLMSDDFDEVDFANYEDMKHGC